MNTQILLLNPETKKQDTFENIEKIYGPPHADNLLKAQEEDRDLSFAETRAFTIRHNSVKRFSSVKSDIICKQDCKQDCKQSKPVDNIQVNHPTDNDKSFIQLFKSMTNDDELLRIMRKCMTLYLYLAGNIKRNPDENDSFNLYENYYKKGMLAVAKTEIELSKRTGIDRGIISNYVNHMKDNGIIEIDHKQKTTQSGTKEHNIYILGTVKKGKDVYNLFINNKQWKTPHNVLGGE